MIVHRREIDVRCGHDVAQRDVGEAAIGIKPFGGAENRGSGVIRRHVMGPCDNCKLTELHFKQLYETMV